MNQKKYKELTQEEFDATVKELEDKGIIPVNFFESLQNMTPEEEEALRRAADNYIYGKCQQK